MAALPFLEVFKRTRSILRQAFPDRVDLLLQEISSWEPRPVEEAPRDRNVYACAVCGRRLTGGLWAVRALPRAHPSAVRGRMRFRPDPAHSDLYVCDAAPGPAEWRAGRCVRDLAAFVRNDPLVPLARSEAALALADCVRAVRQAERAGTEEVVYALEAAAAAPRTFPQAEADARCSLCGGVNAGGAAIRGQSCVLCVSCVEILAAARD